MIYSRNYQNLILKWNQNNTPFGQNCPLMQKAKQKKKE